MGVNPKVFRNMTPEQIAKYRNRVTRHHRQLVLVHFIGLSGVCLFAIGLLAYHLITK